MDLFPIFPAKFALSCKQQLAVCLSQVLMCVAGTKRPPQQCSQYLAYTLALKHLWNYCNTNDDKREWCHDWHPAPPALVHRQHPVDVPHLTATFIWTRHFGLSEMHSDSKTSPSNQSYFCHNALCVSSAQCHTVQWKSLPTVSANFLFLTITVFSTDIMPIFNVPHCSEH